MAIKNSETCNKCYYSYAKFHCTVTDCRNCEMNYLDPDDDYALCKCILISTDTECPYFINAEDSNE